MAKTFGVRLDASTAAELDALVKLHAKGTNLGRITASDVIRAAIHDEYERLVAKPTKKGRKAPA